MADGNDAVRVRRPPPPFRRVQVARIEDLSPRFRRLVLAGPDLDGFPSPDPAASVRLLLPVDGTLVMPVWTGNQFELPDGTKAPIRTLTPREYDADAGELTVDVVVHASGLMADWARAAPVGAETAVSGPGRGFAPDPGARSILVAGDESAVPAIAELIERLPAALSIDAYVEVTAADALPALPTRDGCRVHVHLAGSTPGASLVEALVALRQLPDLIWAAGEAAAMQRIRRHMFDERGVDRGLTTIRGYWKHGRAEG